MRGLVPIGGQLWRVVWCEPGDPRLVVGGVPRLGSADPVTRAICLRCDLEPPLLDRVALHEAAHAAAMSRGSGLEGELEAMAVEAHGIEAAHAASQILGRAVCVAGFCSDGSRERG